MPDLIDDDIQRYGMVGCPRCAHRVTQVTSTAGTRRRRHCMKCGASFTTYEVSDSKFHFITTMLNVLRVESTKFPNILDDDKRKG